MRLPNQKKVLREDLKEAPDWVSGIINVINPFMESVYQALNHNVSFTDNVASFIKEITYKTAAGYPGVIEPVKFQNTLKTRAIGVQILQVYVKGTYVPPMGPVYVPWVENSGEIQIPGISGLGTDQTYIVRLVIF